MTQEMEYRLGAMYPASTISVGLVIGSARVRDKSFILCVELADGSGERLSPDSVSWPYSSALDTSYMYVPSSTRPGLVEFPRLLESARPFRVARFTLRAWGKGEQGDLGQLFTTLVYSMGLSPAPETPTHRTLKISGVLSPREVSA